MQIEEKEGLAVKNQTQLVEIDLDNVTEEEFLTQAAVLVGPIQKTPKKTLAKETFIKVFKYTGDFAKLKSKDMKKTAQVTRNEAFKLNPKKYMEVLKKSINDEESAYEKAAQELFDKLCISNEMFEKSQQEMMNDPYVSMEVFNLGIMMEQPSSKAPEELNKARTIELIKASNDYAFDLFKKEYSDLLRQDPMMMPVMISAIAHDWVFREHGFNEE